MSKAKKSPKQSSPAEGGNILETLKARFEGNMNRHRGMDWSKVLARLQADPEKLRSLTQMEETGGEPDVVGQDRKTGQYIFFDCSAESPAGRRSVCYDREGWESRKEHRPATNAVDMASEMGIALLTEDEYRDLQKLGEFDTKTSSWLNTPAAMRDLGGALTGEFRYGRMFIGCNGAQSYYGVRGFRGSLRV